MHELYSVEKRDGTIIAFNLQRIVSAINKALVSTAHHSAESPTAGTDWSIPATSLAETVFRQLQAIHPAGSIIKLESIQDRVEAVLMAAGHFEAAKAFILYRERRSDGRHMAALMEGTRRMFDQYLEQRDWRVQENANTTRSVNGLNNYIRESFTADYWLHSVYPAQIAAAHKNASLHIHDLGFFGPYCAGWDLRQLLTEGFGGVSGKVSSRPAKHLRSFLGQVVNATFTAQGECAGAQAWSSFDTYCAPFIRSDALTYPQVKQALQEFVFNINVPTRVGFQCPFSNVTLDIRVPKLLAGQAVVMGGELNDSLYGYYQAEMDLFNLAFLEVMAEGDASGRVFTFPIPTVNITADFDWHSPVADALMVVTARYGIPYFANFINSELSPDDAVSMCCRLRLDTSQLRSRGGGLFGSNPLTGSIGVVTINLPQLAYNSRSPQDFVAALAPMVELAASSLEIKRKIIEEQTGQGLYPYAAHWLRHIKARTGRYWDQHFSTIGIIGMNEALLNLKLGDLTTAEGQAFALQVMDRLRALMADVQERYRTVFNLEATPAEGTAYRLASIDVQRCPGIITAGGETPYYTNSTQLPVDGTASIPRTLELQDDLQSRYTGGTVLHLYLGESPEDTGGLKTLIRNIFTRYKLPYLSITPSFSVCPEHGYLKGEQESCPQCGGSCEVWTRVVGYLRPVACFNKGKQQEHADRLVYDLTATVAVPA